MTILDLISLIHHLYICTTHFDEIKCAVQKGGVLEYENLLLEPEIIQITYITN
jgi:hypothetical protein